MVRSKKKILLFIKSKNLKKGETEDKKSVIIILLERWVIESPIVMYYPDRCFLQFVVNFKDQTH